MKKWFSLVSIVWLSGMMMAPAAEGAWQSLFDGKTLQGWTTVDGKPPGEGWSVEEGTLHLSGGGKGGNLVTAEEYESFELEWQWKIQKKGNNGVKYWVSAVGKEWLGLEYQMIDDGNHPDGKPGSHHATASIYDLKAAAVDKPLRPAGEWNHSCIVVKQGKIQHFLNNTMVVEFDATSDAWKTALAASKFRNKTGFAPGKGKVMLTDHNDPAWYKDIRIRRL